MCISMASNKNSSCYLTTVRPMFLHCKKANLYYMVFLIILCSISYLAGVYQHAVGGARSTSASEPFSDSPCTLSENSTVPATELEALEFLPLHSAEDSVPVSEAARVRHFPPCDAKYSEYTPCEDAERSLKFERERLVYRERHCPAREEALKCRVAAPYGYKTPFRWPESRDSVWYANVPHKWLTVEKAGQNWVRFQGDRFRFPGGGTMFPRGADAYIDEIGKLINLRDGSIRTAIDTGCGVSSVFQLNFLNFIGIYYKNIQDIGSKLITEMEIKLTGSLIFVFIKSVLCHIQVQGEVEATLFSLNAILQ